MMSIEDFERQIQDEGVVVFPEVLGQEFVEELLGDFDRVHKICRHEQQKNGVDFPRVAHHIIKAIWRDGSFYKLLENLPLKSHIDAYFDGPYILNTISAISNFKGAAAEYENRPHRDMRSYFPVRLSINVMIFLDAFTEDNGPTLFLRRSHLKPEMPTDSEFHAQAEKMLGGPGSVALFNSDVVHAGGRNMTDGPRRSIVYTLHRPFIKTQFDYASLIDEDIDSPWMQQLLGYYSRTARSYEEWYQPPPRRMYRAGQG